MLQGQNVKKAAVSSFTSSASLLTGLREPAVYFPLATHEADGANDEAQDKGNGDVLAAATAIAKEAVLL